ncbi:MAG: multicopper oxidase domain-containing protein [Rhizobiales bacterium]|nr:multicopper oxidase domain-containing protein [Hyphomicrobiales bacterium]
MVNSVFPVTRRCLLAGLGAVATAGPATTVRARPEQPGPLVIRAVPTLLSLRPDQPGTTVWSLQTGMPTAPRFLQGGTIDLTLRNELPAPLVSNWLGFDGLPTIEPLTARRPIPPGQTDRYSLPLRQAGTFLCDVRLLGDGLAQSSPARALIVEDQTPLEVDRDEFVLIEDWRLSDDGHPTAPGSGGPSVGAPVYLVNGRPALDFTLRVNDRLRLRFINACQRNAIAIGIQNLDVRIVAIDSQPAEPFLARNGRFVLAPGTRIDAVIDATASAGTTSAITMHDGRAPRDIARLNISKEKPSRTAPLPAPSQQPSGNLPARLDLKTALRVEIPLTSADASTTWIAPTLFNANAAPAFRVKRGRAVVLTLTNPATTPMVFHLHGHHVRLLDRLDDGWKPFWLDTVLIDAGQTQRVAFASDTSGTWLMETMAVEWNAPRRLRWFAVE